MSVFHPYGLIVGIAVWVAVEVAVRVGKKYQIDEKTVWAAAMWAVVSGVVGARIYHIIDQWPYYAQHFVEVGFLWQGGLGIFGAIIGGGLGLIFFARGKNIKTGEWLDLGAIALPLGQAIGRWGNYANQELYGKPTALPWGIRIGGIKYRPLFLYESLLILIVFGLLWWMERGRLLPWGRGNYLAVYAIGYGVVRFGLEGLRLDPWQWEGIPVAKLMAMSFIIVGSVWLWRSLWLKRV